MMRRMNGASALRSRPKIPPRRLLFVIVVSGAVLAGCAADPSIETPEPPQTSTVELPAPSPCMDRPGEDSFTIDTLASGLDVPWDVQASPDGRIFITERRGRILVVEAGSQAAVWAELPVFVSAEAGLLGLALDPEFPEQPFVYVVGTVPRFGALTRAVRRIFRRPSSHTLVNRVWRLRDQAGTGDPVGVVIDGVPSGVLHAGAALDFRGDGRLFLTQGDGRVPPAAQSASDLRGTVLSVSLEQARTGEAVTPRVWASGLRNAQGVAWAPDDGALWVVEHGPSGLATEGGLADRDELNRVEEGANLGWPWASGAQVFPGSVPPVREWTPAVAPSDLSFGPPLEDGSRVLWVSTLKRQALGRLILDQDRVRCEDFLFPGRFGRLRSVVVEPDGALLVTTSNEDGQIPPRGEGDLLLRLRRQ